VVRPCKQLSPILEKVVTELDGRVVLAKVDVDANPQLAQGFRAQSIPMVVALVAGSPFRCSPARCRSSRSATSSPSCCSWRPRTASRARSPSTGRRAEPDEPVLPPRHQEAFDAIEAGDYARAVAAYEAALAENPRDEEARAGLGQVRLLQRVQGLDLQQARDAAASAPLDIEAQFAVADLDIAGGHVDDAFARLLDLFAALPSDERGAVRERLIELFGLIGNSDARVIRARGRLTSLLF
jgi:putative thioredoxin